MKKSKKDKKKNNVSVNIQIINDVTTEVLKERDYDKEWDGEELSYSNDIKGFKVLEDTRFGTVDLTVNFEIDPKETYFLVYVVYSDGDSFNHYSGKICYIDLYRNAEWAKATREMIENSYKRKDKESRYGIEIFNDEGTMYKISSSTWTGYFERLEYVEIETIHQKL